MKDLKHLIYFENLLQEANNELVQKAKAEGKYAIGYTCYFMPEVLLDLPGCFSVRLRAPRCTSPDIATYYMSSRVCHYARSLLERALEGGFNFLDAQMATETCTATCRFQEHLQQKHLDTVEDMRIIDNDNFFCEFIDVPFKKTKIAYEHFRDQLRFHVLGKLHDNLGVDVSDEALMQAIEQHNEVCRLINEIGDYRKLDNPTITGYEFHVIQLVSLVCPKYLILPYLRETAEELKTREPDAKWPFRCKVVLAGSENDDPDFTKLIESCGAEVVISNFSFFEGNVDKLAEEIVIVDNAHILHGVQVLLLQMLLEAAGGGAGLCGHLGIQEVVAALQGALHQAAGVVADAGRHVVGCNIRGSAAWCSQPDREAARQIEKHFRHEIAGVANGEFSIRLSLLHQFIVGFLKQILKVDQMLEIFHR